jgi:Zn-dependent M16 (insulinase) family peptidase
MPRLTVLLWPSVYLDHILYPTITASGFTTEVFHVNGKGEEAGVVMSEMQGVEQNPTTVLARKLVLDLLWIFLNAVADELNRFRLQLELYPEGSAYRSETGGMLDALRKLTVEESEFFFPD